MDAVRPFIDAGFSFSHVGLIVDGKSYLRTKMVYGAHEEVSDWPLVSDGNPQHTGSSASYSRRYALAGLTGLVIDQDDDGNAASAKPQVSAAVKQTFKPKAESQVAGEPVSFVPKTVSVKNGTGERGAWTKYGVLSPDGQWFGTFTDEIGKAAIAAKEGNTVFTFTYKSDGKYNTIVAVEKAVEFEEVPF